MKDIEMKFLKDALEEHGYKNLDGKALDALKNLPLESEAFAQFIKGSGYNIRKYVGSDEIYLWRGNRMICGGKVTTGPDGVKVAVFKNLSEEEKEK